MADYILDRFSPKRHRLVGIRLDPPLKIDLAWSKQKVAYPPKVRAGLVFTSCYDGEILALSESSGAILWKRPFPGPYRSLPPYDGELLVLDDQVITRYGDKMMILDALNGQLLRTFAVVNLNMKLAIVRNQQIISCFVDDQRLKFCAACDLQGGGISWQSRLDRLPGHSVLSHDRIFLDSAPSAVVSLDAATGEVVWKESVGPSDHVVSKIIAWNDLIVVGIKPHTVSAFYALTGERVWTCNVPVENPQYLAAYPDGSAHLIDFRYLCSFSAATGDGLQSRDINADLRSKRVEVLSHMEVTDNYLYVADVYTGVLVAIRRDSGTIDWSFTCDAGIPVLHAPLALNGRLFVVDIQGKLYVFKSETD